MSKTVFTVTGENLDDALMRARRIYGDVEVISQRARTEGGVLGIGSRKVIDLEVWQKEKVKPASAPEPKRDLVEAARILQQTKRETDQSEMLKTILTKMEVLERRVVQGGGSKEHPTHPALARIKQILVEDNEFSQIMSEELISDIKKDFSVSELDDFSLVEESILREIGSRMSFFTSIARGKPKVMVLVGPTGVGKTTTIVKLAAQYADDPSRDVRLINLDNVRAGAEDQISSYAEILNIPISSCDSEESLKHAIDLARNADLILVDTAGQSPRDSMKLASMQRMIKACGRNAEVHLTINAATKESDVRHILARFDLFQYKSVILTKMDETVKIGSLISPIIEKRASLSYLTTGQMPMPSNIEKASLAGIWERLDGFSESGVAKLVRQAKESEKE